MLSVVVFAAVSCPLGVAAAAAAAPGAAGAAGVVGVAALAGGIRARLTGPQHFWKDEAHAQVQPFLQKCCNQLHV